MMANLTVAERKTAMAIAGAAALVGLLMAIVGHGDPLAAHGWIVLALGGTLLLAIANGLDAPEPTEDRTVSYYDDPTKVGIILALVWAVVGMALGVWVAAMLAWPDLRFDAAWSSFGRGARCTPLG
jgi:cytochrome c oxidase cbb3-type subunit I